MAFVEHILSNCRATKAQMSLQISMSPCCWQTQGMVVVENSDQRLDLALLDKSAWVFKGSFWVNVWVKHFRINPEFRILRLTLHRKSASKCCIKEIIIASLINFKILLTQNII